MKAPLLTLALIASLIQATCGEEVRLFIAHTNDLHGHLEDRTQEQASGGFVRLASLIRALKITFPDQVIVLDAGDMALGTPTSNTFFGKPTMQAMRSVGYDAVAIGNHEFNWGQEALRTMVQELGAPALCANLVTLDGRSPLPSHTVIERRGARVGVVGLVAPDTASRAPKDYTQGWLFLSAQEGAERGLEAMPDVDVEIALTHLGVPADRELAQSKPQFDLIVGGHSHTALEQVLYEGQVPIVQAGCYANFLGLIEILVDTDSNSLKVLNYSLIPIDSSVPIDPQVGQLVESYAQQVRPMMARQAAVVTHPISNSPDSDTIDTPLGNLVADIFRTQTGSEVALYNRGGARSGIESGVLTVDGIHRLFPFDDPVVLLEVSGAQLQEVVEQGSVSRAKLCPSGLHGSVDPVTGKLDLWVHNQPLDPNKTYRLATTRFLATGGDGMSTLGQIPIREVFGFTRNLVLDYLVSHPNLGAPPTGRLRLTRTP